jgi:hypothetical protein
MSAKPAKAKDFQPAFAHTPVFNNSSSSQHQSIALPGSKLPKLQTWE